LGTICTPICAVIVVVGLLDGLFVGLDDSTGFFDGALVGDTVGTDVGLAEVGLADGVEVGLRVGALDGVRVVGLAVGDRVVGLDVGDRVDGLGVGLREIGFLVGLRVGVVCNLRMCCLLVMFIGDISNRFSSCQRCRSVVIVVGATSSSTQPIFRCQEQFDRPAAVHAFSVVKDEQSTPANGESSSAAETEPASTTN